MQWRRLSISVDFASPQWRYRREQVQKEYLARAMAVTGQYQPNIIDVTAGLGRDAFILASLGCRVLLLERSPVVVALLEDGLARARQHADLVPIVERMSLKQADSIDFLQTLSANSYPESIYLDPMFPPRTKSALVKKEMQVLQSLLGHDNDTELLLESALACVKDRVVVKRPKLASALTALRPVFTIGGKSSRFDIYLGHNRTP